MPTVAWTLLIFGVACLFAHLKLQRFWVEEFTPDCKHYTNFANDGRSFAPYCFRPLFPYIARELSLWHEEDVEASVDWLRRIGVVGILLMPLSAAWLALELGASWPAAAAVVLVIVATDSLYGLALTMPWHIDPPALTLALSATACGVAGYDVAALVLLILLGLAKESFFLMAGIFLLLGPSMNGWIFAGYCGGAFAQILVRAATRPIELPPAPPEGFPDQSASLRHPFRWATTAKAPIWGLYAWNLAAIEATPWLAAVYVPGSPWALPCAAVGILAWAQMLVATDHGRLLAFWVPWGAACVAASAPPWALAVWVLLSLGWPWKERDILTKSV